MRFRPRTTQASSTATSSRPISSSAGGSRSSRVTTAPAFTVLDRETLFPIGPEFLIHQSEDYTLYDISPDGTRFLTLRLEESERRELILVLNWLEDLKERVPT